MRPTGKWDVKNHFLICTLIQIPKWSRVIDRSNLKTIEKIYGKS